MKKKTSINITYFLILMCFLTLMAIVGCLHNYSKEIVSELDSHVQSQMENDSLAIKNNLNGRIQTTLDELQFLSNGLMTYYDKIDHINLNKLMNAYNSSLTLDKVKLLHSTSLVSLLSDGDLSDEEHGLIDAYLSGSKVYYAETEPGQERIYLSEAIKENKNITGIISSVMTPDEFMASYLAPDYIGWESCYLVNDEFTVLSSLVADTVDSSISSYLSNLSDKEKQAFTDSSSHTFSCDGTTYYMVSAPSVVAGLSILSIIPKESALSDMVHVPSGSRSLYGTILLFIVLVLFFIMGSLLFLNLRTKRHQANLRLEKERYQTVFELTSGVLWEFDIKTKTLIKSDPDLGIQTGLAKTEDFGNYVLENSIILDEDIPIFEAFYQSLLEGEEHIHYELRAKDISGEYQWFELTATTIVNADKEPVVVIGQTVNINAKKKELEALRQLSDLDPLTKIPNRGCAGHTINELLSASDASLTHAFLLIDLDNFKSVNSLYGYVFGDALLLEFSTKLKKPFSHLNHVLSRFGGDEFILFLHDIPSTAYAKEQAENILQLLQDMFLQQDMAYTITACIGISLSPEHGEQFDVLLSNADTALFYAKQQGTNNYCIYDPSAMSPSSYIMQSQENLTRMNQKPFERSIIDSTIITNVVEILFDARDIKTSINMILSLVGNFYDLYYIAIFENMNNSSNMGKILYKWCIDPTIEIEIKNPISLSKLESVVEYNKHNNNLFYSTDREEQKRFNAFVYDFLEKHQIDGLLECGILENGTSQGYIGYTFKNPDRDWTQHEIDSISLITKILGGYLNRIRTEETAKRLQLIDPLTNAMNLSAFTETAYQLIGDHKENAYLIFYSDIDKFKLINDTYGYSEGDRILIEFASAMDSILQNDECFGRISGDRFVGLFNYNNPKLFLSKIKQLNDRMNRISKTETDFYRISIIIGLSPVQEGSHLSLSIDRADMARKSIIARHKSRYCFFNEAMKSNLMKQREIEDLMDDALEKEEFLVYYQPKVRLIDNEICGAEALVRWLQPEKGLIPPNDFIPIFEENKFILKLDLYVFEQVCKHLRKMLDQDKTIFPVSVNFSRLHLGNREILNQLQSIVTRYQVPTSYLELELTESALQENNAYMFSILKELHNMGFKISMDDFGSGLSSLNLLRTIPFDVVKLDKDFFHQETSTERERIVITNIVKMAQELHMKIVSEGVETKEQAAFLRSIHCDMAQGYLYAKPMPVDEYESTYYK